MAIRSKGRTGGRCRASTVLAGAATVYVANDGVDGPTCGTKTAPCRSITAAVGLPTTVAGDRILVGPGRYGDLDGDGVLGEPGEETPASGCRCMLAINKAVEVESSEGAAATLIDGRKVGFPTTVLLIMTGGHFGKPGKGFVVTRTRFPVLRLAGPVLRGPRTPLLAAA